MYRLITAGCVLALGLLLPIRAAEEKAEDNPAVKNSTATSRGTRNS
jgi:hypothetical protein